MDEDEAYARKLQEQFDAEETVIGRQLEISEALAKKISAVPAHNISDSEDEILHTDEYSSELNLETEAAKKVIADTKPVCNYGESCYRKNRDHLGKFWHPAKRKASDESAASAHQKKAKYENFEMKATTPSTSNNQNKQRLRKEGFEGTHYHSSPYHVFLNKVFSLPATHKHRLSLVFPDLLMTNHNCLVESVQVNFMVDLQYVVDVYRECKCGDKPLLVLYGQLGGATPSHYPNVTCCQVKMPYQYGVHHSKVMMLHYENGLRIVIHTANLIEDDWHEKTQGLWVSPLFPRLENGKSSLMDGESETGFKKDLVNYVLSYKNEHLTRWAHIIKSHDFSECRAMLVASVPGYHIGPALHKYGHMKVRHLLQKHSQWKPDNACPVIAQCSSIGSLGNESKAWLTHEFGVSLSGGRGASRSTVNVVYPSEEDVRKSSQGYAGGSCLPYNSKTHSKQNWLAAHLHYWRSGERSRSMPHIKTYTRLRNNNSLQFFLLTSSNLSKAAWGQLQKQQSQLFIRSYELGVLLLPKFLDGCDQLDVQKFPMPYDLPLVPYAQTTKPWLMDTAKATPDVFGNLYP